MSARNLTSPRNGCVDAAKNARNDMNVVLQFQGIVLIVIFGLKSHGWKKYGNIFETMNKTLYVCLSG